MANLNVIAGNCNSLFKYNSLKFKKSHFSEFDIMLLADTRVNLARLEIIKKFHNFTDKSNHFFTAPCREIGPKHGCLIYVNCRIIENVIESNNQTVEHNLPRLAYLVVKLKGIGLVILISVYCPCNGRIAQKSPMLRNLLDLVRRLGDTYCLGQEPKFIIGGDFNFSFAKPVGGNLTKSER